MRGSPAGGSVGVMVAVSRTVAVPAALLALCATFEAYLSAHSIFEWMFELARRFGTDDYFARSHWDPSAMPLIGYLEFDTAALARFGEGGGSAVISPSLPSTKKPASRRTASKGWPVR